MSKPPPPGGAFQALPPNWTKVDDPAGAYYWNTVTQAVSWTPPENTPGGPPPPIAAPPRRSSKPGAVGADARNKALNDPQYQNIVNRNAGQVRSLQKGLSNLDIAVRMPPGTAVPPPGYQPSPGFANLPPPSGYSAPPPGGGGPPPPGRGPPPGDLGVKSQK